MALGSVLAVVLAASSVARLGEFSCVAVAASSNDQRGHVTCRPPTGPEFSVSLPGEEIRLSTNEILGRPTLVAVGAYYSGDDEWYETALLGLVDGRVRDLWPHHWIASAEDVLCIGDIGGGIRGVLGVVSDWVSREAHAQPHQFRITRYEFDGETFAHLADLRSHGRYDNWCPAVTSLGLGCSHPYGDIRPLRWHKTFECGDEPQNNALQRTKPAQAMGLRR